MHTWMLYMLSWNAFWHNEENKYQLRIQYRAAHAWYQNGKLNLDQNTDRHALKKKVDVESIATVFVREKATTVS